ncbi:hypothetical protein JZ751_028008, partial [Albula glossodonta]
MASAANLNAVRETMDVLLEISRLLNTGLDMESLSICVRLCEQGINPEALSSVIKELRKASDTLKVKAELVSHREQYELRTKMHLNGRHDRTVPANLQITGPVACERVTLGNYNHLRAAPVKVGLDVTQGHSEKLLSLISQLQNPQSAGTDSPTL